MNLRRYSIPLLLGAVLLAGGCLSNNPAPPLGNASNTPTPHAVAALKNRVVVTDPHLDFTSLQTQYGPPSISIYDAHSKELVNRLSLEFRNPTYVTVDPQSQKFYVVSSGSIVWNNSEHWMESSGGISVFSLEDLDDPYAVPETVAIEGAPGKMVLWGKWGYLPSALSPVMYKVDLNTLELTRGPENPIVVHNGDTLDTLHAIPQPNRGIWVTSFNTNSLYLLNPETDGIVEGPIKVNLDPGNADLEGPVDLALRTDGGYPDLFVLKTISNAIAAVDTRSLAVTPQWAVVGPVGNRMTIHDGFVYTVNSGANNIQRTELNTATSVHFASFHPGCNPWEATIIDGQMWVPQMLCAKVAIVDLMNPTSITYTEP
jgi:DNA-binding beta-propeller fold protein YncE